MLRVRGVCRGLQVPGHHLLPRRQRWGKAGCTTCNRESVTSLTLKRSPSLTSPLPRRQRHGGAWVVLCTPPSCSRNCTYSQAIPLAYKGAVRSRLKRRGGSNSGGPAAQGLRRRCCFCSRAPSASCPGTPSGSWSWQGTGALLLSTFHLNLSRFITVLTVVTSPSSLHKRCLS